MKNQSWGNLCTNSSCNEEPTKGYYFILRLGICGDSTSAYLSNHSTDEVVSFQELFTPLVHPRRLRARVVNSSWTISAPGITLHDLNVIHSCTWWSRVGREAPDEGGDSREGATVRGKCSGRGGLREPSDCVER